MSDFNDDDDNLPGANASGIVSEAMINYLQERFPTENKNDGGIDPAMKEYLDEKFNTRKP